MAKKGKDKNPHKGGGDANEFVYTEIREVDGDAGRRYARNALKRFIKNGETMVCTASMRGFGLKPEGDWPVAQVRHADTVAAYKGEKREEKMIRLLNNEQERVKGLAQITDLKCAEVQKDGKLKPLTLPGVKITPDGL